MMQREIRSVSVFCGSNRGAADAFAAGAHALGRALGSAGITLIYGGTASGLMGVVADAALEAGGTVHGVIQEGLHDRGLSHQRLTRHEVQPTLRRRKERMVELADAFIALPGGIGTMEELFEVWAMNQLLEADKPIGLLNVDDFFGPLLAFVDHMVATKFLPPSHRHSIVVERDPDALTGKLREHVRVDVPKWL